MYLFVVLIYVKLGMICSSVKRLFIYLLFVWNYMQLCVTCGYRWFIHTFLYLHSFMRPSQKVHACVLLLRNENESILISYWKWMEKVKAFLEVTENNLNYLCFIEIKLSNAGFQSVSYYSWCNALLPEAL